MVGTGAQGHRLDARTKDIPITSSNLFRGDLSKAVLKAATASRNYNALGDCFVLSGLARTKPPRSLKWKASASPLFHGDSRPRYHQGQVPQTKRGKKGMWLQTHGHRHRPTVWQVLAATVAMPQTAQAQRQAMKQLQREEGIQHLTRGPGHESEVHGRSGAGPPVQTPPTPCLPLPPSQNPKIPQRKPLAGLTRWTPPVLQVDLTLKDTYCFREILVAGRLAYILPFWEVIQADRWVLEIIRHGYSIELI